MAIKILVEPAIEPVTLLEAKSWLRLDSIDEDDLLTALIKTSRTRSETITNRAMITQTVQETFIRYSANGVIDFSFAPVQAINSVVKIAANGVETILAATDYFADMDNNRIKVNSLSGAVSFRIEYIAGYGLLSSDVPASLKTAILLQIAWLFEHRDEDKEFIPRSAQMLLASYGRIRL
ncbi:MAG: phage head-tail connector protein [Robiginitomaculum sp.]|nr:phage head-tail connector protein [Robiginitomaculum sp.]